MLPKIRRCLCHAQMPGRDNPLALHQLGYYSGDGIEFVHREGERADFTLRKVVAQNGIRVDLYRYLREQAQELPSAADTPEKLRVGFGNPDELTLCRHECSGDDALAPVATERGV